MAVEVAGVTITVLEPGHWPDVARVYAEGIATGDATFETGTGRLRCSRACIGGIDRLSSMSDDCT